MSKNFNFIYLASQSPRRSQLLTQLGVHHELLLPDADEDVEALEEERAGELPFAYALRVTLAKLKAAQARLQRSGLPNAPVLCADTAVALGRRLLGKPLTAEEAITTLRGLSGRCHRVISAVVVANGTHQWHAVHTSRVTFAPLTESSIEKYVASGEPFGKAGAYAIQGAAAAWITHIEGSYSGIMGLPLYETAQLLQQCQEQRSHTRN